MYKVAIVQEPDFYMLVKNQPQNRIHMIHHLILVKLNRSLQVHCQ